MPLQAFSRAISSSGRFSESPMPWMVGGDEGKIAPQAGVPEDCRFKI
jgi:hypothetical protein